MSHLRPDGVVVINRDPFARCEEVRRPAGPGECQWCGQTRRTLYEYGVESDSRPRPSFASGRFCNVSCKRSYHA